MNGVCLADCGANEVEVAGKCVAKSLIGEACEADEQCQGGSSCLDATCTCPEGEEAVEDVCMKKMSRPMSTCPVPGQIPYLEPRTKNARFCSPSRPNCPRGFSCQFSQTAQQNICCGGGKAIVAEKKNGKASTFSSKPNGKEEVDEESAATNVCDRGSAYVVNGTPKQCTASPCPSGYKCTFSKKSKNYYCCSSKASPSGGAGSGGAANGCATGTALLFPSTGTPVQCSNSGSNSCPAGYKCQKSTLSNRFQCCSVVKDGEDEEEEVEVKALVRGRPVVGGRGTVNKNKENSAANGE